MSEETLDTSIEQTELNSEVEQLEVTEDTPQANETEEQAKAKGWRPESEFRGNKEDFVSAKEYLRVGEMIDRQKKLERTLNLLAKQNQDMYKKFQDAESRGYKQAIEELKYQRKEALSVGDDDKADQITEQIHEYQNTAKQEEQKAKSQVSPEVIDFVERNKDWFQKDFQLTQTALKRDQELRYQYPGKSEAEILQMIEDELSPKRQIRTKTPPPVAGASRSSEAPSKTTYTINDLNRDERLVFNAVKECNPSLSVSEWIKQMKDVGAR